MRREQGLGVEAATVQTWKPAEAQGEEPVPSWKWGFLPG